MQTTTIQAIKARQNFGELLEMAYYQNKQFRIARKNKAMARLVNENFMTAIDQLIEDDPALADTLAIMLNPEIRKALEKGEKDYQAGKAVPLDDMKEEYDQ
jgi:hypothetical protein